MSGLHKVVTDSRDGIFDVFDALTRQGLAPKEPTHRGNGWSLLVSGSFDDLSDRVLNATFADCELWACDADVDATCNECGSPVANVGDSLCLECNAEFEANEDNRWNAEHSSNLYR